MDSTPSSTDQTTLTVAQAVAQAAAQAQASPVQPPLSGPSSTIDNLTCQWQGCGERCDTAEALYDHVCERHVGRKSTNNLNLTCQWGACRTTTVKRDHITSHIRVHVPLKPHKCDFCGKSFKRPQDLKKHVKTHADDSVLANSPSQGSNGRALSGNGGMGPNGKGQSSYYPTHDGSMHPFSGYQHSLGSNGANATAYTQPGGNQYGSYGAVSYPNSAGVDIHSLDTRRRAIEALNDFLGDIKRRALNPQQYMDVGQRLGFGNSLPLPVGGGYNTGYSNSSTGASFGNFTAASLLDSFNHNESMNGGGGLHGPMTQGGYSLPLSHARTKNDLQDIDRFLEQLQQTVYETSNHAAAAGIQQPGVHAQYTGDYGFNNQYQSRSSGSPPNFQGTTAAGSFGGLTAASMPGMTAASSTSMDTPALTPASVSSYSSSGQSPLSSHGRNSLGSMNGNAMYPSLPSVTGISDLGSGYPTTSSAPASGLASGFEGLDGRRYSGGRLQRQAPGDDTAMADADDGTRTPKQADSKRSRGKANSSIDPALRDEESSDSASTPAADEKRQEDWVENIRTIETLRKWVAERLSRGEYDEDGAADVSDSKQGSLDEAKAQAEIAMMVQAKIAGMGAKPDSVMSEAGDVKYPSLPTA
ncbi:hypothetical protein BAUCODRAFT_135551 [Baudoinia panamericana UAMH 10762]|uniref:C2H2-type domain-containing protein n=1 Tax=Baudoinia panamericana (strain UAMH 10762) TaxID=717646 RepID=M2MV02_BAUPA|nr:uncharacterized protein BAUCODRAFT_135551 [Baudoinia panamericana UAMH 10762]EMD00777.1 hypothetical protein BAUCODRAFT_135551 [Baudoinia panamericana UAMH 10762]